MARFFEGLASKPGIGVIVLFFVVAVCTLCLCWSEASKE